MSSKFHQMVKKESLDFPDHEGGVVEQDRVIGCGHDPEQGAGDLPAQELAVMADPVLLATDLADYLVCRGVPFRQAHHAVGLLVAHADKVGKPLNQLSLPEMQAIHCAFAGDALRLFDLTAAMERRNLTGAPGPKEVRRQLARWRKTLTSRAGTA